MGGVYLVKPRAIFEGTEPHFLAAAPVCPRPNPRRHRFAVMPLAFSHLVRTELGRGAVRPPGVRAFRVIRGSQGWREGHHHRGSDGTLPRLDSMVLC